jgi:hypothetical protein
LIPAPPAQAATPVLRIGFTELSVKGMLIRWIHGRKGPIGTPVSHWGEPVGGAHNHLQGDNGKHHFDDMGGGTALLAWEMGFHRQQVVQW